MYLLGFLVLLHCGYSVFEYNQLPISYNKLDIVFELLFGLGIMFFSAVFHIRNQPKLNISNQMIKSKTYLNDIRINQALLELNQLPNTYHGVLNRKEFINLHEMQSEYRKWKGTD